MPDSRLPFLEWPSLLECLGLGSGGVVTLVGAGGKTTLMFALAGQLAAADHTVLTTTTTKIQPPTSAQSPLVLETQHADDLLAQIHRLDSLPTHLTALAPVQDYPDKRVGLSPSDIDALSASGCFRWILVEGDGAARKPLKAPAEHEPVIPPSSDRVIVVAGLDGVGQPLDEDHVHRADLFAALGGLALGQIVTPEALARVLTHPQGGFKGVPQGAKVTIFFNKADTCQRGMRGEAFALQLKNALSQRVAVVMGAALKGRAMRVL